MLCVWWYVSLPGDCHVATFVAPRNDTWWWFVRCTCDNSHHFLSRRSSRHFVPQDDTWGRCVTHCSFGCGCPTILSFRATAWESSRQAHFAPLDCHVATFVAPRNDKEESEYSTCQSGGCKIANLRNRLPSSLHYMRARTCTYTHTCDSFIHEL